MKGFIERHFYKGMVVLAFLLGVGVTSLYFGNEMAAEAKAHQAFIKKAHADLTELQGLCEATKNLALRPGSAI